MLLALAFCLAVLAPSVYVQANTAGTAWLLDAQQDDGQIASEGDLTTADHSTFEALRALHAAGAAASDWVAALTFIDAQASPGNPWLSRRLLAAQFAQNPDHELVFELLRLQNPDGGFGEQPGDQSSLLDTLDALEALGVAGIRDGAVLQPAIGFVLTRQTPEGGFAYNTASPASGYLTARVVQALQRHQFEYGLSAPFQAAGAFLETRLARDGEAALWEHAHTLLALIPAAPDSALYQGPLETLRSIQEPDGSWDGSVFTTALALRALLKAEQTGAFRDPGLAAVSGRVVDAVHGESLVGASAMLVGVDTEITALTGAAGRFSLAGLLPGSYVLQVTSPGFETLSRGLDLTPGLLLDLGPVSLALEPGTALLAGTVTDAETGQGLAARVGLVGSEAHAVTAMADGVYLLPVPAGEVQVSASAPGYQEARAEAVLAAGDRLVFSPALGRDSLSDPDAPVELTGRLVDADSLRPVTGVAARVSGTGAIAVSDETGRFVLAGLPAGEILLELWHASYQPAVVRLLATAGTRISLGDLLLQPNEGSGTTVQGQVMDAYAGHSIAGAQVRVGDHEAETDAEGRYRIDHIEGLVFDVRVNATGYRGGSRHLVLEQAGLIRLDFALERTGQDGVRIAGITAHAESVGAFEEARFTVAVENEAEDERRVALSATVEGLTSAFREDFLVAPPGSDRGGAIPLAAGELRLIEFGWFTRHLDPGQYQVRTQAWSADGTALLSEAAARFTIVETLEVASVVVSAEPRELVRGESAEAAFTAIVRNGSNTPAALQFSLALHDPMGATLHEQDVRLELFPAAGPLRFDLGVLAHEFESAGLHALEVTALSGVPVDSLETGAIVVAPNMRVHGSHVLEPSQIPPLNDAVVRIRLAIEGMEDDQ